MKKKYLAKIIATDNEGLQIISACSAGAKVKVFDIKYIEKTVPIVLSNNLETGLTVKIGGYSDLLEHLSV